MQGRISEVVCSTCVGASLNQNPNHLAITLGNGRMKGLRPLGGRTPQNPGTLAWDGWQLALDRRQIRPTASIAKRASANRDTPPATSFMDRLEIRLLVSVSLMSSLPPIQIDRSRSLHHVAARNYSVAPAARRICSTSVFSRQRATYNIDSPLALRAFTSAPASIRIFRASCLSRHTAVYKSGSSSRILSIHFCICFHENLQRFNLVSPDGCV